MINVRQITMENDKEFLLNEMFRRRFIKPSNAYAIDINAKLLCRKKINSSSFINIYRCTSQTFLFVRCIRKCTTKFKLNGEKEWIRE